MAKDVSDGLAGREFTVLERSLAQELKVSGELIKKTREARLTEGVDWVLRKKRVWLTAGASAALRDYFAQGVPPVEEGVAMPSSGEKTLPVPIQARRGPEKPPVTVLRVFNVMLPNPRFIQAVAPAVVSPLTSQLKLVRVRNREVYARGQFLECRHETQNIFTVVREPRWRGEKVASAKMKGAA